MTRLQHVSHVMWKSHVSLTHRLQHKNMFWSHIEYISYDCITWNSVLLQFIRGRERSPIQMVVLVNYDLLEHCKENVFAAKMFWYFHVSSHKTKHMLQWSLKTLRWQPWISKIYDLFKSVVFSTNKTDRHDITEIL